MDIYSKDFTITLPDVGESASITNKGFLKIFQEIGAIHSSMFGLGLNDVKKTGLFWILLNWKLKVFSRPKWNETVNVSTWCSRYTNLYFYRDFKVCDSFGNVITIATSKWILFDFNKNSVFKLTDDFFKNYCKAIDINVFDAKMIERFKEPENNNFVTNYTVLKRDIDNNHHVNNLNYLDFAYEAIPSKALSGTEFNNVEIMYKHEAKLGDTLNLFYVKDENTNIITIKNNDNTKLHCIVKLFDN